ncbi:MAG: hypothetical protein ABI443_10165, partial [Chthoniobacterales bacterium]
MKTLYRLTCLIPLLALAACAIQGNSRSQVAEAASLRALAKNSANTAITLYTLNPHRSPLGKVKADQVFHGFGVVGQTVVTAAADRQTLLDSLATGVESSKSNAHVCFNPRHGLRVLSGEQVTDYVICFQCMHMKVYPPNGNVQNIL